MTVIATNFPADMPRKNLFSGGNSGQTVLKEDNAVTAKKEINNTIGAVKSTTPATPSNVTNNDFIKKVEAKKIENIIIDDDTDDWSAVPAFLRRKK